MQLTQKTATIANGASLSDAVQLHVDQNPQVTTRYGIRAMPTLMIFKGGQVAASHTGALVQKKRLEDWIHGSISV